MAPFSTPRDTMSHPPCKVLSKIQIKLLAPPSSVNQASVGHRRPRTFLQVVLVLGSPQGTSRPAEAWWKYDLIDTDGSFQAVSSSI